MGMETKTRHTTTPSTWVCHVCHTGHGNGFDEQANGVESVVSLPPMRLLKSTSMEPHQLLGKRTQHPSAMEATRIIQVSLQQDPQDFEHASVTFLRCDDG